MVNLSEFCKENKLKIIIILVIVIILILIANRFGGKKDVVNKVDTNTKSEPPVVEQPMDVYDESMGGDIWTIPQEELDSYNY